ncbi:hypothetical protein [Pseudomonas sp. S2_F03]
MRTALTILAAVALAGCATTPTPINVAEQVPADAIYGFQSKPVADSGKITIVRDSGMTGSGCDLTIYIDGKRAAKMASGQKVSLYVESGSRNLGVGPEFSALCGSAAIRTTPTEIRPGQDYLFRLSGDMQGFYLAPHIDYGGK